MQGGPFKKKKKQQQYKKNKKAREHSTVPKKLTRKNSYSRGGLAHEK